MNEFLNDFNTFYTTIASCMGDFWNWYSTTILGEITIFTILIGLFFFILTKIVNMKNDD